MTTMATIDTAATALERQRRRYAHACAALAEAESESARKRHARRAVNAQRGMAEARRTFSTFALIEA